MQPVACLDLVPSQSMGTALDGRHMRLPLRAGLASPPQIRPHNEEAWQNMTSCSFFAWAYLAWFWAGRAQRWG